MENEVIDISNVKVEDDETPLTSITAVDPAVPDDVGVPNNESLVKLLPKQASRLRFPPGCSVVYMDCTQDPPMVVYDTVREAYLDLETRQGMYCLTQHANLLCPESDLHFTRNVQAWALLYGGRQVPVVVLKSQSCKFSGLEDEPSVLYSVQESESKTIHHSLLAQHLVFRNPNDPKPPPVPETPDSSAERPFGSENKNKRRSLGGDTAEYRSETASANSRNQKQRNLGSSARKRASTDLLGVRGELPSKRNRVGDLPEEQPAMTVRVPPWAATAKLRDLLLASRSDLEHRHSCYIQLHGKLFGTGPERDNVIIKIYDSLSKSLRCDVEDIIASQYSLPITRLVLMHDLTRRNRDCHRQLVDQNFVSHRDTGNHSQKWTATVNFPWVREGDPAIGAIVGPRGRGIKEMNPNSNCLIKIVSEPRLIILISGEELANVKQCFELAKTRVRWASQRFDCFKKP